MNEEEYGNFINEEVKGSETAVSKMLMYYISALQSAGVEDVKQYVATRIGDMISLSEEQQKFILINFYNGDKLAESIDNCIELLTRMLNKEQMDKESLNIVIKSLTLILKDYKEFKYDK